MDGQGKVLQILLSLKGGNREINLKVVKDSDFHFTAASRNVAVTTRKATSDERNLANVYIVKIPQWLVLSTERERFADITGGEELGVLLADLNRRL